LAACWRGLRIPRRDEFPDLLPEPRDELPHLGQRGGGALGAWTGKVVGEGMVGVG
jgi:hypothetical protein